MTAEVRLSPSHDVVEHTSELRLLLQAGSPAELLAEAGRALAQIELRGRPATAAGPWRRLALSAHDPAALLIEWLNELLYLAETERWLALEFEVTQPDERSLVADARGATLEEAPGLVKAATLHGARLDPAPGGATGEVVLDV